MPKPPKGTPPKRTRHRSHRGGPIDITAPLPMSAPSFADMGPMGQVITNIFQSMPPEKLRELFPKVRAMMNSDAFRDSLISIAERSHQLQLAHQEMFSCAYEIYRSLDNENA
jgi:hypothetical protein